MEILQGIPKSTVSRRFRVLGTASGIGTTWMQLANANPRRQKLCLYNGSALASATGIFYIAYGTQPASIAPGTPVDYTFALRPGDLYEDWNSIDNVWAVVLTSGVASDALYVTEMI